MVNDESIRYQVLPKSLEWLVTQAPAFPVNSNKVHIITEPSKFYGILKSNIEAAEHRITLASLYLGNGQLEQDLVSAVEARLSSVPDLQVQWLLDYTRGSRQPCSSRHMLRNLLPSSRCQVGLFHTPELRGMLKKVLPQRWNEVVGLQHMKLYICDDSVIISGANLSHDYFTNRQDRYFLLTDVQELANFLHDIVAAVSRHSLQLQDGNTCVLHPAALQHPFLGDKKSYCKEVETSVRKVWDRAMVDSVIRLKKLDALVSQQNSNTVAKYENNVYSPITATNKVLSSNVRSTNVAEELPSKAERTQRNVHHSAAIGRQQLPEDTLIFPTLQMKSFNITYDADLTERLLTSAPGGSVVHLASGYFNLTRRYMDSLLGATAARVDILSAHPEANGFLGAKGVSGAIPAAYTQLAKQFLLRVSSLHQRHRVTLWEFRRLGWTFHGKGLWYTAPHEQQSTVGTAPCLSLIGSPNFGWRSANRDLESQLVVVTTNDRLRRDMEAERHSLYSHASLVSEETFAHASRYVKMWVRLVVPVIKRFF